MFEKVFGEYNSDLEAMQKWVDAMFEASFTPFFAEALEVYSIIKADSEKKFTDQQLERLLTSLPLDLFQASEKLNAFRLMAETVKLKNKDKISDFKAAHLRAAHEGNFKWNASDLSMMLDSDMLEYNLLYTAYTSLITRAENQMSFCREVIMATKKIWDSRRSGSSNMPVSPPNTDEPALPPYGQGQQYVK